MPPNESWYCWWTKSCFCNHLVFKNPSKKWEKLPTLTGVEFLNHLQHESFLFHPVSTNPLKVLGALLNCCFRQVMAFLEQLEGNWLAEKKKSPTIFVSRGASFAQKSPLLGVEIIQLDQNPPNQLNHDKYL